MKRKSLLSLMLLCFAFFGVARAEIVEIGTDGGTSTNSYLPAYTFYNNTLSEQIYTADEIGNAGTINSIAFYNGGSLKSPQIKIYLVHTDQSAFTSNTGWLTVTEGNLVYSGTVTFTANAWTTITLNTPFVYDGTSNLGLVVDEYMQWSSGLACRVFTSTSNCSMYVYSDDTDYNAVGATYTASGRLSVKNQLKLDMTIPYPKPMNLTYTNVNPSTTNLAWTAPESENTITGYAYQYKKATDTVWSNEETLDTTALSLTPLEGATAYNFRVKTLYGENSSKYTTINFTTIDPCSVPTNFVASDITDVSAVISWTIGYDETAWLVKYKKSTDTVFMSTTVADNPTTTLSGLEGNTLYNVVISPDCDENKTLTGNFTTKNPCAAPTNLVVSDITHASATLTWTPGYHETEWTVMYWATDTTTVTVSGDPTVALDHLAENTLYKVRVYNCENSVYTTFTTLNPCTAPTNLVVSDITHASATLTWTPGYQETEWTVMYWATDTLTVTVNGEPTVELTHLAENTLYKVRVYNCENSVYTTFTTKNPCAAPTNLVVSDITINSATLSWTPGYQETEWTVMYCATTAQDTTTLTVNDNPTVNLTGLSNYTTYNVKVYNCDNGLSGSFTTATVLPLNEEFATTTIPAGWYRLSGLLGDTVPPTSTTGGWYFGTASGVFDSHARVNIYGSSCKYWLVTPTVLMNEENVRLTFDLALTKYSGTLQPVDTTQQADDKFVVLIATNDRSDWTVLRQWDNAGSEYVYNKITCSETGEKVVIDLSEYAGQYVAIAFYGESTETGGDNYLHVDNVTVELVPSCEKPLYLESTAVTATTATLAWTSDADAWQIVYSTEEDFNPDEATPVDAPTNPYVLDSLTPETTYYAYVRANCGNNGISGWSNICSFEPTAKQNLTVNDSTVTNGFVPVYGYWCDNYSRSQFIIPAADLAEMQWGTISKLTFYSSNSSVSWGTAAFAVYMTETADTTLSALQSWDDLGEAVYTGSLAISGNKMEITLATPFQYMGGNLLIGVNETKSGSYSSCTWYGVAATGASMGGYGTSISQQNFLPKTTFVYIPGEEPDCMPVTGLTVNYTGGNTAEVSWTSETTAWNLKVNDSLVEGPITNPYILTGLEYATTYTVEVQSDCGGTTSTWASTSFTTDLCAPEDMCEITCEMTDSYGDGWNGNAINVVDVATGNVLATWTMTSGSSASATLNVCDGREIQFVWVSGSYAYETSYVVTGFTGEIFSGSGAMTEPVNYTVKCSWGPCDTPAGLAAEPSYNSAELTWNGGAETYNLRYREVGTGFAWDSFTQVGSDITADSIYRAYTFDLRSYAGQSGHIAIRHYNVSDQYVLLVDDVTYNNGSEDVFSIDFEDGIPEGCMLIDKDGDGFNWQRYHLVFVSEGDTTNAAHSGEYGLWSASYDNTSYTVLTPDNWVITPYMELGGTLTFYAKGLDPNYASEVFGVFVSTVEELNADNPWIEVEEPITGTSYSLTGLSPLTTYEFQVQVADKACSDPEPEWSASKEFTTLTDKIFVTDGNWNEGTNWISGNVPAAGVDVIINANAIIPAGYDANVNEIEMGEGATITIQDGGQLHHNNTTGVVATVEKNITGYGEGNGNWYLISAPFRSYYYTSQVANLHMADSLCDFYGFDATQNEQEWRNYKQTAISSMLNGKGYLYANPTDDTLKFTGTTAPQLSNLAYINGGSSYPLSYNDSISELNWNLVGNSLPHNAYVYVGIVSGGYVYFAENQYYYKMNETGTDIIAADNEMVKPMEGVFVLSSAASQYAFASSTSHGAKSTGLNINLAQDNALIDRALIRFGEGSGLQKFQLKSNHTKVYMTEGDKDYAVLFTDSEGKMPLSFQAETEGTYTISYTAEGVSFSSLLLIDNETGEKVDLLANPSYTFETKAGDFAKRFTIVYGTK